MNSIHPTLRQFITVKWIIYNLGNSKYSFFSFLFLFVFLFFSVCVLHNRWSGWLPNYSYNLSWNNIFISLYCMLLYCMWFFYVNLAHVSVSCGPKCLLQTSSNKLLFLFNTFISNIHFKVCIFHFYIKTLMYFSFYQSIFLSEEHLYFSHLCFDWCRR